MIKVFSSIRKILSSKKFLIPLAVIIMLIIFAAIRIWTFGAQNELVDADAAIVLGAAVWDGQPSPVFEERLNHAIWIYENEYVDKLILTGGKAEDTDRAESQVAKDYAIKNQVQKDDILIETKSSITEENFKYAQEIAAEHELESFIVVSDPLHMRRAITIAETKGMDVYPSPTPGSAYETLRSQVPFLIREVIFYIGYIISLPYR